MSDSRPLRQRTLEPTARLALTTFLLAGCSEKIEVESQIRVGELAEPRTADDRDLGEDGPSSAQDTQAALRVLEQLWRDRVPEAPAEIDERSFVAEPPRNAKEFEAILAAIEHDGKDGGAELAGPALNLAAAGSEVWPQLRDFLQADRPFRRVDYVAVLKPIGGDVPNRYGHFALSWKRRHGHSVRLSEDWLADLLALEPGRIASKLRPVQRDLVSLIAASRAAARAVRERPSLGHEVIPVLLELSYGLGGVFRDELGRSIQSIGESAVPALVRAAKMPEHDDPTRLDAKTSAYAEYNLDRMDRGHPRRALEAATQDPARMNQLLQAYGENRMPDAAAELLRYVDASDASLREAARASFMRFVEGPPPKMRHRTRKLLGGGTKQTLRATSFRRRAELAIAQELGARFPELVEEPCITIREDGTRDAKCDAQALRHTQAYFQALDQARADELEQQIASALAYEDPARGLEALDSLGLSDTRAWLGGSAASEQAQRLGRSAVEARTRLVDAQLERTTDSMTRAALLWGLWSHARDGDPQGARVLRNRARTELAQLPGLSARELAIVAPSLASESTPHLAAAKSPSAEAASSDLREQAREAAERGLLPLLMLLGSLLLLGGRWSLRWTAASAGIVPPVE